MKEDIRNEIIGKVGFPLYVDYWEKYFFKMTGDQVKEVLQIVFHFNKTYEVLDTSDLAVDMVISTIIDNIKRDASKRIKQSKASRDNGKKGGRPPKREKPKTPKIPKSFKAPSLQDVQDYCKERNKGVDAEKWLNYYQSNGWKVGKNSMKDWKAAVRTWEGNSFKKQSKHNNFEEQDYYAGTEGFEVC